MAAEYIARNPAATGGLALWAAYPAANTSLRAFDIAAVSIYGDADGVASVDDVRDGANRLPADTPFIPVSYTHLDVYKRQDHWLSAVRALEAAIARSARLVS